MNKKLLLKIGVISTIITPLVTVVACLEDDQKNDSDNTQNLDTIVSKLMDGNKMEDNIKTKLIKFLHDNKIVNVTNPLIDHKRNKKLFVLTSVLTRYTVFPPARDQGHWSADGSGVDKGTYWDVNLSKNTEHGSSTLNANYGLKEITDLHVTYLAFIEDNQLEFFKLVTGGTKASPPVDTVLAEGISTNFPFASSVDKLHVPDKLISFNQLIQAFKASDVKISFTPEDNKHSHNPYTTFALTPSTSKSLAALFGYQDVNSAGNMMDPFELQLNNVVKNHATDFTNLLPGTTAPAKAVSLGTFPSSDTQTKDDIFSLIIHRKDSSNNNQEAKVLLNKILQYYIPSKSDKITLVTAMSKK